nr:dihydrofolate reductase [Prevotella sp. oral taxon 299]
MLRFCRRVDSYRGKRCARASDTFFPDYKEWKEKSREHHEKDEKHAFAFDFVHYVKA